MTNAAKELRGTLAKNPSRRNPAEPQPTIGRPDKPQSLSDDAVASNMWDGICDMLDAMKLLTVADGHLISTICQNESMLRLAAKSIRTIGTMIEANDGTFKKNPDCVEWHKCMDRRLKLLAELGLTPSARSRLSALVEEEVSDPFTEFMELMGQAKESAGSKE